MLIYSSARFLCVRHKGCLLLRSRYPLCLTDFTCSGNISSIDILNSQYAQTLHMDRQLLSSWFDMCSCLPTVLCNCGFMAGLAICSYLTRFQTYQSSNQSSKTYQSSRKLTFHFWFLYQLWFNAYQGEEPCYTQLQGVALVQSTRSGCFFEACSYCKYLSSCFCVN